MASDLRHFYLEKILLFPNELLANPSKISSLKGSRYLLNCEYGCLFRLSIMRKAFLLFKSPGSLVKHFDRDFSQSSLFTSTDTPAGKFSLDWFLNLNKIMGCDGFSPNVRTIVKMYHSYVMSCHFERIKIKCSYHPSQMKKTGLIHRKLRKTINTSI